MANFQYYKLMGKGNVNVKIKPGILPHIFHSQKDHHSTSSSCIVKPAIYREALEKRKWHEYVSETIQRHEENTKLEEDAEKLDSQSNADILKLKAVVTSANKDKCIQIHIKTEKKSKFTQCNF